MKTTLFASLVALMMAGCGGVELSTPEETRLTGDYHYLWDYDSVPPKLNICRRTSESGYTLLIADVLAYGWTNGIIIAECRTAKGATVTNAATYAILKIYGDGREESVYADLTHEDFVRKRTELGIPEELTFTRKSN
ncbi:MAG: hypothetical protein WCI95_10640 [bacterium]